ncbi:uncharacterized protein EHS24_005344 [Apiotrichum porosum]|uniref:Beta-glucosidase 1B n=1 Tax=Apiotrichum porosum TaxID=105984 RepID=A0A427XD41_9TREE|nr:uncharacterized protein EHS24_005344 [Apiotrichum porosum]RSH76766.1 hypothetical protein EHS24_005344 [Apiotrichum porosum]
MTAIEYSSKAKEVLNDGELQSVLPREFLYGAASASFQIEGGAHLDNKSSSVWDTWTRTMPFSGEQACDSYHRFRDDVALLKQYGFNSYRFSLSWPRILPHGKAGSPVNQAGMKYYSDLIDALLEAGITPVVTLFHWDLPQCLADEYDGFRSHRDIIRDFSAYARICFEYLGDRVKHWITINEPQIFTLFNGVALLKDSWRPIQDYAIFARSLILCHAHAYRLYKAEFAAQQKGIIGITLNCDWVEPFDESEKSISGAQLRLDWNLSLFADPIYLGRCNETMQHELGEYKLNFTPDDWQVVAHSSDFTCWTDGERVPSEGAHAFIIGFGCTNQIFEKDGKPLGTTGHMGHPVDAPWGFRKLLRYVNERYIRDTGMAIMVTENGMSVANEAQASRVDQINDVVRQEYYAGYIRELVQAVRDDGILISGYMAWSLLDNLEWVWGYEPRYGLTIVDHENAFRRIPKHSAYLLRDIFRQVIRRSD